MITESDISAIAKFATPGYDAASPERQAIARNAARVAFILPLERLPSELEAINARRIDAGKQPIDGGQVDD